MKLNIWRLIDFFLLWVVVAIGAMGLIIMATAGPDQRVILSFNEYHEYYIEMTIMALAVTLAPVRIIHLARGAMEIKRGNKRHAGVSIYGLNSADIGHHDDFSCFRA